MLTATFLPQELRDLLDQDPARGQSEIRQRVRCSATEARQIWEALQHDTTALARYPNQVALLVGDPQPRLLAQLKPQRSTLLRLLRRGQRLEALELLSQQGLSQREARQFLQALSPRRNHWDTLLDLYQNPPQDFWLQRPDPEPIPDSTAQIVFPPETFSPKLVLQWLSQGQIRSCTLWIRQLTGCPRERCQALVDRLDELVFDQHPNPWNAVAADWPDLLAALAGLPDPLWLKRLSDSKDELIKQIQNRQVLATIELLCQRLGCTSLQARRFLKRLGSEPEVAWQSALAGPAWALKQPTRPRPPQSALLPPQASARKATAVAAPSSTPAPGPAATAATPTTEPLASPRSLVETQPPGPAEAELCGPAEEAGHLNIGVSQLPSMPWATDRAAEKQKLEKDRQAYAQQRNQELERELEALDVTRAREADAYQSDILLPAAGTLSLKSDRAEKSPSLPSTPITATPVPALDLNNPDQLLEVLTRLGKACRDEDWDRAGSIYAELERAGFSRAWVSRKFPELEPWLPQDPWSQRLPQMGKVAEGLGLVLRGDRTPKQVIQMALKSTQLEGIISALEQAWKSRKKEDIQKASRLVQENPQLAEELNRRIPWLSDLFKADLDKDGTPDVAEAMKDPMVYFEHLLKHKFPELEQRLGAARIESIREALPELLQTTKERNMRGVMRVMSRLRLGPSDVKALLSLLKSL